MMSGKKLDQKINNIYVPVFVGPTSSGKTSLAIKYCKKYGGSVISADSRQIYSEMDIGTGKVPIKSNYLVKKHKSFWEMDGVKVYGYDLADLNTNFTAYDYANYVFNLINDFYNLNAPFVIAGGTGFYIDILTGRIKLGSTAPDPATRLQLQDLTLQEQLDKLQKLNSAVYKKIDIHNPYRVARALEKELSQIEHQKLPNTPKVAFKFYGLTAPRDFLYNKVDAWVEEIWPNGLIKETMSLDKKYPENAKLNGLVYKTVKSFVTKQISEAEAIQRIKWDLHAYIRRQLTWFKKNTEITWLDISQKSSDDFIKNLYN